MSAPIEPLTDEESSRVLTKTPRARWVATQQAAAQQRASILDVQPAGMSFERALEIAIAALDAETR